MHSSETPLQAVDQRLKETKDIIKIFNTGGKWKDKNLFHIEKGFKFVPDISRENSNKQKLQVVTLGTQLSLVNLFCLLKHCLGTEAGSFQAHQ